MKSLIIEKDKLVENIHAIQNYAKDAIVIAVLKCNAYGLGLLEFAQVLSDNGITHFAVSDVHEGVALRKNGFTQEILLLSATCLVEDVALIGEYDITATVADKLSAELLNVVGEKLEKSISAHIKIDTGFGRFGFNSAKEALDALLPLKQVTISGAFSHLSDAFGKEAHSRAQFTRFIEEVKQIEEGGIPIPLKHMANSSAFLRFSDMHLDAVRIGSAFLGRLSIPSPVKLNKIAYLESLVSYVKTLPKGSNIGYANTCRLKRESKIAVIGVGYSDGFGVSKKNDAFRAFDMIRYIYHDCKSFVMDNRIFITIHQKRYPLLGRISMYNVIADITGSDIAPGDVATFECNPILINASIERKYIES